MSATFSMDNDVFSRFVFYSSVVLSKTIFMSVWTAVYRITRKVFPSPEDYKGFKNVTITTDEDVERARRCHLNDLENVLPFVLIGLLYVATSPDLGSATLHFRAFAAARLCHSVAYLGAIRQPTRALSFTVGFIVNVSMAIQTLMASSSGF